VKRYTAPDTSLRDWLLAELAARHVGALRAITWAHLAALACAEGFTVQADERNLREEVNALQASDGPGALICSSSRKPYGVFIAADYAEFQAYQAETLSRATTLMDKARAQAAAAERAFRAPARQLGFAFEAPSMPKLSGAAPASLPAPDQESDAAGGVARQGVEPRQVPSAS